MSSFPKSGQIWKKETGPDSYIYVCLIHRLMTMHDYTQEGQLWSCIMMEYAKENKVWIYPNIDILVSDAVNNVAVYQSWTDLA